MAYPKNLLSDGEVIEYEMKPHWRALIVPVILLLLDIFIGVWLFVSWGNWFGGIVGSIGRWVVAALMLIVLIGWVIRPFLFWITTEYVFTNRRVITRAGLISKKGRDMPLSKVNNVTFEVPALGRLLNYGRLEIVSASAEDLVINDVPNVEVIQRDVYRLYEEDDQRRRSSGGSAPGDGN